MLQRVHELLRKLGSIKAELIVNPIESSVQLSVVDTIVFLSLSHRVVITEVVVVCCCLLLLMLNKNKLKLPVFLEQSLRNVYFLIFFCFLQIVTSLIYIPKMNNIYFPLTAIDYFNVFEVSVQLTKI